MRPRATKIKATYDTTARAAMVSETPLTTTSQGNADTQAGIDSALRGTYAALRCELVWLQAADVIDDAAINDVMTRLDETQLRMKADHGLKGNNPRGHTAIPLPNEQ